MSKLEASEITETVKPTVSPDDFTYITIPAKDLYDHSHPGVQLNRHKFEAGRTYRVRGDAAAEIQMRLDMFAREQVRLLRPNADQKALNDVNRGSQWSSRGGTPVGAWSSQISETDKVLTVDF